MTSSIDKPLIEDMPDSEFEKSAAKKNSNGSKTNAKKKPTTPPYKEGKIAEGLTQLYTVTGSMVFPFDQICGENIINNAENMANSLDKLARDNLAVRRALMKIIEGSAWGAVLAAHGPVIMGAMMHHAPSKRSEKKEAETTWQTSVV